MHGNKYEQLVNKFYIKRNKFKVSKYWKLLSDFGATNVYNQLPPNVRLAPKCTKYEKTFLQTQIIQKYFNHWDFFYKFQLSLLGNFPIKKYTQIQIFIR